jgi:hypothetical protein
MGGISSRIGIYPIYASSGGGGATPTLQEVTTDGNTSSNAILVTDGAGDTVILDAAAGGANISVQADTGEYVQLNSGGGDAITVTAEPNGSRVNVIAVTSGPSGNGVSYIQFVDVDDNDCALVSPNYEPWTGNRIWFLPDASGTIYLNTNQATGNSIQAAGSTIYNIAHGLGVAPSFYAITPEDAGTGTSLAGYYATADPANIRVVLPVAATSFKVKWLAIK